MSSALKVVLVTGSRSLTKNPQKEDWAKQLLLEELQDLSPGCIVLQGGAAGPDTWAGLLVKWATVETHLVDGLVIVRHLNPTGPSQHEFYQGPPYSSFLARDRGLVMRAVALQKQGFEVSTIALEDPESPTGGTRYTLSEAAKARLPWKHAIYPQPFVSLKEEP